MCRKIVLMVLPEQQCSSVRNDVAGWSELIERLRGFSIAAIGLEASGGYERGVMRALLAADMSVRQINPFKLRQFAKASGVLPRTIASTSGTAPGDRPASRRAECDRHRWRRDAIVYLVGSVGKQTAVKRKSGHY